jgi:hypothetical protein
MRKLITLFCITLLTTTSHASGTVSQSSLTNSENDISPIPPRNCTLTAAEAEIIALKQAGQPVPDELYHQLWQKRKRGQQDTPVLQRQGGDTIEDAVPVELGTTVSGTTAGYTDDYDETCPHDSESPDVVYLLTLTENSGVILDLCDSDYWTKVYVYDTEMNLMGCNTFGCPNYYSYLVLNFLYLGNYYVIVDGRSGGDGGDYIMHILEFVCEPLVCEGSEEIEDNGGCNAEVPVFQTIAFDETICGTTWMDDQNRDEDWFEFELTDYYEVNLTVEAYNFDPKIFLVSDPNFDCTGETLLWSDNSGFCEVEELSLYLAPGHYYTWIHQSDWNSIIHEAEYALTLTGEEGLPEAGEYCHNPIQIESLPYYREDCTTDNVNTWGNISPDEWYRFSLPEPGEVYISLALGGTSDFDTYLWLLTDDCDIVIDFNDDS